jgi:hypothetical protein
LSYDLYKYNIGTDRSRITQNVVSQSSSLHHDDDNYGTTKTIKGDQSMYCRSLCDDAINLLGSIPPTLSDEEDSITCLEKDHFSKQP